MTDQNKTREELIIEIQDLRQKLNSLISINEPQENKLAINVEILTRALEVIQTGSWDLNLIDGTAYRTLQHDKIFGYDTLLPNWTFNIFLEHVLPEDRQFVADSFNKATSTESDWSFECRIRRVDNAVRWIQATGGHHTRNSDGKYVWMFGLVKDITEKKHAEHSTKTKIESLQWYHDIAMERELKMVELKKEINELLKKHDGEEKYIISK